MSKETTEAVVPGARLDGSRDRAAAEPGGCECECCECIFIGEPWHTVCRVCKDAMHE